MNALKVSEVPDRTENLLSASKLILLINLITGAEFKFDGEPGLPVGGVTGVGGTTP